MLTSNYYAWKDAIFRLYKSPAHSSITEHINTEIKDTGGTKIVITAPYCDPGYSKENIAGSATAYWDNARLQAGLSVNFGDDSSVVTYETYNPASIDISDRSVSTTLSFNGEERYVFICNGRNTSSSSKTITKVLFYKNIYTKNNSTGYDSVVGNAFIFSIDLDEPVVVGANSSFSITTEMVIS